MLKKHDRVEVMLNGGQTLCGEITQIRKAVKEGSTTLIPKGLKDEVRNETNPARLEKPRPLAARKEEVSVLLDNGKKIQRVSIDRVKVVQ